MAELEAFGRTLEIIYDAAIDATLWPRALEVICDFTAGVAARIAWQDAASNEAHSFYTYGSDPHYDQLYLDTYADLNPFFPALAFVEPGRVTATDDHMPNDEFFSTRFFKEWVEPQGWIGAIGVNLERTATSAAFFHVQRGTAQGTIDQAMRRRFQLLVPHVTRALAIGRLFVASAMRTESYRRALERLSAAVILIDVAGRAIHFSDKAEELVSKAELLVMRNGTLRATEPNADRKLQEALAAAKNGDTALGEKGVEILLGAVSGVRTVASVLSLSSSIRREASPADAVAAVFVREMTLATPTLLETIAERYKLTASELRITSVVTEQSGIAAIAGRIGISEATVKTHLGRIYAKTGTRKLSDLVRLIGQHAQGTIGA